MQPSEVHKDVPIYIYHDGNDYPDEFSASIEWYGRMIDVKVEKEKRPTLKNIVEAAYYLIDLLRGIEAKGYLGNDGYIKHDLR